MSKRSAADWLSDIVLWGERLQGHLQGVEDDALFLSTVLQGAASECAEAIGEAAGKLDDIAALNDTFPDFNLKLARRSGRPALSRILSDRPRHTLEYRHHCGPENGRCG
jgi:hypothetical protein